MSKLIRFDEDLCGWTGHNLFLCYYRRGFGPIRRLWLWSMQ